MRKRNIQIIVRLNEKEIIKLNKNLKKSGLPRETYIRALINGFSPKETPPIEYHLMMRKLHEIGNSLNQIGSRLNVAGHINTVILQQQADRLRFVLIEIQAALTTPERINSNGDNSDMGCERPP